MSKVLILGGYGNFGKRIAKLLTRQNIPVIIAGRDLSKAEKLKSALPSGFAETAQIDVNKDLGEKLALLKPKVVINTCGPFQNADYTVAHTCIKRGVHYIDLADGRDFVTGITQLNSFAQKNNVSVISGASTVPCLSSAVIEHFKREFSGIDSMTFGIAPGQKAERGLATTAAILGYVGKKLKPCAGYETRYGWQDLYIQKYPEIGSRMMANCDIPDLDLLPQKYRIKKIKFSAGMENPVLHIGIWLFSWLVRIGLPIHLEKHSSFLLKVSNLFDFIGSSDGGMHVVLEGKDLSGNFLQKKWFIIALNGDGPYIPTVPSVVLAKKLLQKEFHKIGVMPCVGLVTLEEYLRELSHLNVRTYDADI